MQKIESEKNDCTCLHRPCSRPTPQGRIGIRTHSESSNSLIRFRCSNSRLLLETGIAGHPRLFLANDTQKPRKNCENGGFSKPLTGIKSCTVDRGCTPAPKDATKQAVFFRFFRVFPLTLIFNKKQCVEVIFRLSRRVSRKYQENG